MSPHLVGRLAVDVQERMRTKDPAGARVFARDVFSRLLSRNDAAATVLATAMVRAVADDGEPEKSDAEECEDTGAEKPKRAVVLRGISAAERSGRVAELLMAWVQAGGDPKAMISR